MVGTLRGWKRPFVRKQMRGELRAARAKRLADKSRRVLEVVTDDDYAQRRTTFLLRNADHIIYYMNAWDASNTKNFLDWCTELAVHTLVIGTADTNGSWIGKLIPVGQISNILNSSGIAFSNALFAVSPDGSSPAQPPAEVQGYFPRIRDGYPDIFLYPDLHSVRLLPWGDGLATLNGVFQYASGALVPIAPRNILVRQVNRAQSMGLDVRVGCEFEFYLLPSSAIELADGGYRITPGSRRLDTYMVRRAIADLPVLQRIRQSLETAGLTIAAINSEMGTGQYEITIRFANALQAADDAFLYKNTTKQIASQCDLMATFMAKPQTAWPGSSCHLHQSLWNAESGSALTWSSDQLLSGTAYSYLAGLLHGLVEFTALFAPTINSYKRLIPYSWAGTTQTWGVDNRTTCLRVVGDSPDQRRIEHRLPGADVNPYLAIAACLASGLNGVEKELRPGAAYQGDAYADDQLATVPGTLAEALDIFESSNLARETFGDDFVDYYVRMKRWEVRRHQLHVSDWEVHHYIENV